MYTETRTAKLLLMKFLMYIPVFLALIFINACQSESHESILRKCTILGDESIIYARANYVKLFHYFNPDKFNEPFQQVKDFDHAVHRNTINTYDIAVLKIKSRDETTNNLLNHCKELAEFSKTLVDQSYPRAIAHKSEYDKLSDNFFIEINKIVKFDHNIGTFDNSQKSFKQRVNEYQFAVKKYIEKYKSKLPANLINERPENN